MANVIEGAHGLALYPEDNLKYATVVEPSGTIRTTDGENSHWWWRTKAVIHTPDDGTDETIRTTKLPTSALRAASKYAEKVAPNGAAIGGISENGEAVVFTPVRSGEVVKVTRRWTRNTRKAHLLSPGHSRRGVRKFKKRDAYRINTEHVYLWGEKNLVALKDAANRIMRSGEGKVIFAR